MQNYLGYFTGAVVRAKTSYTCIRLALYFHQTELELHQTLETLAKEFIGDYFRT